jgi:hypothetical protein
LWRDGASTIATESFRGKSAWWWLALTVILLLGVEMFVLLWTTQGGRAANQCRATARTA